MKLREGAFYKRRDGQIVGPVSKGIDEDYPFMDRARTESYTSDGEYLAGGAHPHLMDLIEEVPPPGIGWEEYRATKAGVHSVRADESVSLVSAKPGDILWRPSEKPAKRPLQVGDRVRAYDTSIFTGTVTQILGEILLITSGQTSVWRYPKQCRRLVKRERRRVWVQMSADGTNALEVTAHRTEGEPKGWVPFVEVRKK